MSDPGLVIQYYMRISPVKSIIGFSIYFSRFLRMMMVKYMNANEFKFYCSHCDQPLSCDPWREIERVASNMTQLARRASHRDQRKRFSQI